MAEPIEIQFVMLSLVGPRNLYYMGMCMPPHRKRQFWGCLANWKAL